MRLAFSPITPDIHIPSDTPSPNIASLTPPDTTEIVRRLRQSAGMSLSEELVDTGAVDFKDLRLHKINRRLADTAQSMRANYEEALKNSNQVARDFSKKFLMQAQALTWTCVIPLSPHVIEERFRRLSVEFFDPLRAGTSHPEFDHYTLTIKLPLPIVRGTFSYMDFVHEALHGISGRHACVVTLSDDKKILDITNEVTRSGLRFTLPHLHKPLSVFEWLNEGLVEHLVSFFIPDEKQDSIAYPNEVDIIRALTAPDGLYKIPLRTLTAAFFADYDHRALLGIRYPEWHDLTRVFPTQEMLKISRLIDNYGSERTLCALTSQNIFGVPDSEIDI